MRRFYSRRMEFLFGFVADVLIMMFGQWLCELIARLIAAPFQRNANPIWVALSYATFGLVWGALSLWAFPRPWVKDPNLRVYVTVLVPVALAVIVTILGAKRRRENVPSWRHAAHVACYAWALLLIRYFYVTE